MLPRTERNETSLSGLNLDDKQRDKFTQNGEIQSCGVAQECAIVCVWYLFCFCFRLATPVHPCFASFAHNLLYTVYSFLFDPCF